MKKILLFGAVFALTFTTVQSQEIPLGVKAGINFASIGGDDVEDVDGRTNFHIGGLVEIPLNEKFSIQPEILYSGQGAQMEYSESFTEMGMELFVKAKQKLKMDYINVPIMAKYYIIPGLAVEAGPQVGFLVSAKLESEAEIKGDFPQEYNDMFYDAFKSNEDVKDELNTLDFAIGLGASYRLDMGVFFGLRYNLGLSNIHKESGDLKNRNNIFQISAGYSF